jgi:hypothetical protein
MARKRIKKASCPNCEFKFTETDNYCPNCGQENHTHKVPLKHYVFELLEATLHFDTKIFVTLRDLLFKPGEITNNYNQNKRARYVPPLRVYIFISFIFFVLLSVSGKHENKEMNVSDEDDSVKFELNENWDTEEDTSGNYLLEEIRKTNGEEEHLFEEYFKAQKIEISWYNRNIYKNIAKREAGLFSKEEFQKKLTKNLSWLMFFLMPVFALYLRLLYLRRKQYYSEHLIFSIHFHSVLFIILTFWILQDMLKWHIGLVSLFMILAYLALFVKKVYAQSWMRTILKSLLLVVTYGFTIAVMLIITLVISAIF